MGYAYDQDNIFARIVRGEIPNDTVLETAHSLAFNDIGPQAPVHVLVIPKGPYVNWDHFVAEASADEGRHQRDGEGEGGGGGSAHFRSPQQARCTYIGTSGPALPPNPAPSPHMRYGWGPPAVRGGALVGGRLRV